eukprot:CAMPEP_0198652480 /NCGR_PEP_ID=MMETSP1467-20131203/6410_1 /TAXON_ID=1462469 /ORGANISM="unid. sp., Strain CCMP2135" /LENGTH=45 /DNA_ID= /DNA_START= /DNA_END= /DNA_ORIENTATION=
MAREEPLHLFRSPKIAVGAASVSSSSEWSPTGEARTSHDVTRRFA